MDEEREAQAQRQVTRERDPRDREDARDREAIEAGRRGRRDVDGGDRVVHGGSLSWGR